MLKLVQAAGQVPGGAELGRARQGQARPDRTGPWAKLGWAGQGYASCQSALGRVGRARSRMTGDGTAWRGAALGLFRHSAV